MSIRERLSGNEAAATAMKHMNNEKNLERK